MSTTSHDILTEILEWSRDRPEWQRDALRRLFSAEKVTPQDVDELVGLCKAARGLTEPASPKVLSREHLGTKSDGGDATTLVSLTHYRGANALAAGQTVTFGPNLTIIYGQNAAGKSGYARLLKKACRSRFTEEIFGNLLSGEPPVKLQATITFRQGEGEPTAWTFDSPPLDALAAVSVFDAGCAPVYLRDKTDVAYRPFGLDTFDRLATLCGEVRNRLESEKAKLAALAPILPTFSEGTKPRHLIDHLTALTNPDDVRALATFSEKEQVRLSELRAHQQDVLAADPKRRARELTSRADRVDLLSRHVASIFAIFRGSALAQLGTSAEALRAAQASLELLRKTALTSDLLTGTGDPTWRKMWEATEEFSAVAYPQSSFPFVESGAHCPFCQQELGSEAQARLQKFAEYVASRAQAQVREAERTHGVTLATVREAVIRRPDLDLALNEIRSENPPLAQEVESFLQTAAGIQSGIEEALAQGVGFLAGMKQSPESDLQAAASHLRERAKQLLAEKPTMSPEAEAELKDLEARTTLGGHLQVVLDEIERKKHLAAYDQCLGEAVTNAITKKSTDLTSRLVTDQLRAGFQEDLRQLEFNHLAVEIRTAGGAKGALFHKLVFSNAPGVPVAHVLSEGESRTLSLASFLTELKTAASRSAIIFDDPVSSLDEAWRERIARRLVSEANARQVIVFTHDLLFLKFIMDEAKREEVPCTHQYVRREGEAGICSPDLPWAAMGTGERIGVLRRRLQHADKLFRTARGSYEADARDIFGLLREAWERATTEVLLNDVVERFRHSIETKKVRDLHDITDDDYKALEAGMAECSRWLRGHDRPPADGTSFPEPEALKNRVEELATWVTNIRNRRRKKPLSELV
jgi:hypothetical protein